jgi:hypothetical protein
MIDDNAEYEQRRQIRAQADADVAEFIASLSQDEGSGVPPPPTIKVSEVSSQAVELDLVGFGTQGAATAPGAGSGGGGPPPDIGCPCIRATFNDIEFCGCQNLSTASVNYTDVNWNGFVVDMWKPDPSDEGTCSDCSYQEQSFEPSAKIHARQWDANGCTGGLVIDADQGVRIYVMKIGSTWGIMASAGSGTTQRLVFYAETTDISAPIPNQLNCDAFPFTLPVTPFTVCMTNINNPSFRMGVTTGGTVTITPQTDDCGACCQGLDNGGCSEGTLAHCDDYSGTFDSGAKCGSCCYDPENPQDCSNTCAGDCSGTFIAESECHHNDYETCVGFSPPP